MLKMEWKKSKKITLSTILLFIALIIIIALICFIFVYKSSADDEIGKYKSLYQKSMDIVVDMSTEGRYPNAFYATIEEITDVNSSNSIKALKVKGLDSNSSIYRGEFNFQIYLDSIDSTVKIQHNGNSISFDKLKVGQTIAVYDYSKNISSDNNISSVYKIDVLDDNI